MPYLGIGLKLTTNKGYLRNLDMSFML